MDMEAPWGKSRHRPGLPRTRREVGKSEETWWRDRLSCFPVSNKSTKAIAAVANCLTRGKRPASRPEITDAARLDKHSPFSIMTIKGFAVSPRSTALTGRSPRTVHRLCACNGACFACDPFWQLAPHLGPTVMANMSP